MLSSRAAEQSARQRQEILAKIMANDFSQLIERAENQLHVFGSSLTRTSDLLEVTNDRVYPLLVSSQLFTEVGVYDSNGILVASAMIGPPARLPTVLENSTVQIVRYGTRFYESIGEDPAGTSPADPTPRLRLTVPVGGANNKLLIIVGDIDSIQLATIVRQFETLTNSTIAMTARNGTLLLGPPQSTVKYGEPVPQLNAFPAGANVADYTNIAQTEVLGARSTIPQLGWTLLLESPSELIYKDVRSLSLNLLIIIAVALPLVVVVGRFAGGRIARPIRDLHAGVENFGENAANFQPVRINTNDELKALGQAFNRTAERLRESQAELERSNERLEQQVAERTESLQRLLEELEEKSRTQEELLETVRRLSLPVIPLTRGMVVMPLVGEITPERASDLCPRLLHAIEQERARVALLDISGVPVIDRSVAQALVNSAQAARLVGAEVVLVGIRPEVSESLVSLEIPLQGMQTAATLEQGISLGTHRLNGRARPRV